MPYIVLSTLTNMLIQLPDIEVQNNIALLLELIDNKIKMESDISNLFIQQKHYLLSQMFI